MRKQSTILKMSLVGLFLASATCVMAQTSPLQYDKNPKANVIVGPDHTIGGNHSSLVPGFDGTYEEKNSVLFYKSDGTGTGLTLVSSLKEDHETRTGTDALSFTKYKWYYLGADSTTNSTGITKYGLDAGGTEVSATITDANKRVIAGLDPGYHYFMVEGYIIPEGADETAVCAVAHEIFAVFVLPPLKPTLSNTGDAGAPLQYCEADAASQSAVKITANVDYDSFTGNPDIANANYELKYTWYAVKSNDVFGHDNTDFPTINPDKINITGADAQDTVIAVSNSNEFTPTIAAIGAYKFFVEVEYTVKDRRYDKTGTEDNTNRDRPYVIYRGWFGGADQDNASVVYVTPKPGKPHITIESVQD